MTGFAVDARLERYLFRSNIGVLGRGLGEVGT